MAGKTRHKSKKTIKVSSAARRRTSNASRAGSRRGAPVTKPTGPRPGGQGVAQGMTVKKTTQRQGFKTNEFIVYPAHGVGQIVAIPRLAPWGNATNRMDELCAALTIGESAEGHPPLVLTERRRRSNHQTGRRPSGNDASFRSWRIAALIVTSPSQARTRHQQTSRPCLPASRVSAAVHTGNYNDCVRIDPVVEPVWKSAQQCATSVPIHDLVQRKRPILAACRS